MAEILGAILVHLPTVDHLEVRGLLIEGILRLAHYHQETVLTSLLRQPLPMERWVPRVRGHGLLCNSGHARLTLADTSGRTGALTVPCLTLSPISHGKYSLWGTGDPVL